MKKRNEIFQILTHWQTNFLYIKSSGYNAKRSTIPQVMKLLFFFFFFLLCGFVIYIGPPVGELSVLLSSDSCS